MAASSISGADRRLWTGIRTNSARPRGGGVTCFIVDTDTPDSTFDASSTPFGQPDMPPSSNSRICAPSANILGELNKGFASPVTDHPQRIPYAVGCIGVAIKADVDGARVCSATEHRRAAVIETSHPVDARGHEIDIRQATWITLEAAAKADRGEPFRKRPLWPS